MLRLVPIDSINPSSYNPRKADQKRLKILELSLSKLGFVMPIYCDKSGEILSGHQ
ncbi:ParB N-terminal domain-containing protein [Photobacterium damselae subsp. damselae]|nr:ParB N-terminal domain-containing protein [Photobacterium damselae]UKA27176.1 ParB N-terminal domain-containing protein [Photobacterium damselae subsp. damselae]